MKKYLFTLVALLFIGVLAACGTSDDNETDNSTNGDSNTSEDATTDDASETIVVGATSTPHAEILEEAKSLLAEEGITLEIEVYQDYVFPNEDLASGTLDANYFQHIPYFESQKADKEYDFANLGGIHIEPYGFYSKDIKSVDDITEGTVVIMSNSVADHGRALSILEEAELIKLDENVEKVDAQVKDIVENPLNLEFDTDVDAGFLPEFYERETEALVAINGNYALQAGLSPTKDALLLEGTDSPYVNIIAVRSEDKDKEALQKLVEVLHSEAIQNFINEKYEGKVVPVAE
ncbi:MetQ/NlpA family ABC transporter substrate-binding protein [Gracilibacillus marinus]|uniref:Lipoprotein n=1 Tax=Gracilibacillus marinus TaxID=630535 RepID=A0ABV8VWL3_9BACI